MDGAPVGEVPEVGKAEEARDQKDVSLHQATTYVLAAPLMHAYEANITPIFSDLRGESATVRVPATARAAEQQAAQRNRAWRTWYDIC
jgi:hypothetical protein